MADDPSTGFNVFVSWSLERSGAVATALHKWLPSIIQRSRPWMSERDIYTGQRWRKEIAHHLATIKLGVLCVTPENIGRPWLNFEAGALSRTVNDDARVCCYCLGLKPVDLKDPLADFNGVEATVDGTWKLVRSINASLGGPPVPENALKELFDAMWPKLDGELKAIPSTATGIPPKRSSEDMIEEILGRVREVERSVRHASVGGSIPRWRSGSTVDVALQAAIAEYATSLGSDGASLPVPETTRALNESVRTILDDWHRKKL
jgi:hypothetical protein